jgi:hypothetical protein
MPTEVIASQFVCNNGHVTSHIAPSNHSALLSVGTNFPTSIATWKSDIKEISYHHCNNCQEQLDLKSKIVSIPPVLAVDFAGRHPVINSQIVVVKNNRDFTNQGMTWFHDGVATGAESLN